LIYREADFLADGSLRDICVLDTEILHWQKMFDALANLPGEVSFEADGEGDFSAPKKLSAVQRTSNQCSRHEQLVIRGRNT
jgi:hypothetical protein